MVVVVLKIIELDIGPVATPGGSDEYLDLSSLGGANEKKVTVKIQHRNWRIGIDHCINSGNGLFEGRYVIV